MRRRAALVAFVMEGRKRMGAVVALMAVAVRAGEEEEEESGLGGMVSWARERDVARDWRSVR